MLKKSNITMADFKSTRSGSSLLIEHVYDTMPLVCKQISYKCEKIIKKKIQIAMSF